MNKGLHLILVQSLRVIKEQSLLSFKYHQITRWMKKDSHINPIKIIQLLFPMLKNEWFHY